MSLENFSLATSISRAKLPGLILTLSANSATEIAKSAVKWTSADSGVVIPESLSLLLTSDEAVRKLNASFRGMDKTTNVLSFPQFKRQEIKKFSARAQEIYSVGDIALSSLYVAQEAKIQGKILKNHVTHLLIHGILHLFGYDHMTAAQAARMEILEKKIMAELGLPDPYESPTPTKAKRATSRRTKA